MNRPVASRLWVFRLCTLQYSSSSVSVCSVCVALISQHFCKCSSKDSRWIVFMTLILICDETVHQLPYGRTTPNPLCDRWTNDSSAKVFHCNHAVEASIFERHLQWWMSSGNLDPIRYEQLFHVKGVSLYNLYRVKKSNVLTLFRVRANVVLSEMTLRDGWTDVQRKFPNFCR